MTSWTEKARAASAPAPLAEQQSWTERARSSEGSQGSVDLRTRFEAGMKATEAGKLNYLREKYGKANVRAEQDGSIKIKDPSSGAELTFDPSPRGGFTWDGLKSFLADIPGDIADLSGDALEFATQQAGILAGAAEGAAIGSAVPAVGNILGGALGGYAGAGAGGVAGNLARQAASAALPGSDELTPIQRGAAAADAGQFAMAGESMGPLVRAGLTKANPANWVRRTIQSGADPRMEAKAAQITSHTGIEFTPGQAGGGRTALRMEGALAQREGAGDIMFAGAPGSKAIGYLGQAKQFETFARKLMRGGRSAEAGGEALAAASDKTFKTLRTARSEQWKQQMSEVARLSGGKPVLPLRNTIEEASAILDEYKPALGPASQQRFAASLIGDLSSTIDKAREQLLDEAKARGASAVELRAIAKASPLKLKGLRADALEFQQAMADIGEKLHSRMGVAASIDPSRRDAIVTRMMAAMRRDLDAAADMGELNGEVAAALKGARQGYAQASDELDAAKTRLLVDALELSESDAPDLAIRNMVTNKSSTQIKRAMQILGKYDTPAAVQARQDSLGELFRMAKPSRSMAAREVSIGPVQFYNLAKRYEDNIRALYTGDKKGYLDFKMLVNAAERMADSAGVASGGAQTKLLDWFGDTIDIGVKAVTSPKSAIEKVATTVNSEGLARIMAVGGTRDFLQVIERSAEPKSRASAAARLMTLLARDNKEQDRQPEPTPAE